MRTIEYFIQFGMELAEGAGQVQRVLGCAS
jgi:hypothetical protein